MGQMKFFVEYIGPSTNQIYAGKHWTERRKHKRECLQMTTIALAGMRREQLSGPVSITITPTTKKRRAYDPSNYSYTLKMIEDALVSLGLLADDTGEHVRRVTINRAVRGDRDGVEVEINDTQNDITPTPDIPN